MVGDKEMDSVMTSCLSTVRDTGGAGRSDDRLRAAWKGDSGSGGVPWARVPTPAWDLCRVEAQCTQGFQTSLLISLWAQALSGAALIKQRICQLAGNSSLNTLLLL